MPLRDSFSCRSSWQRTGTRSTTPGRIASRRLEPALTAVTSPNPMFSSVSRLMCFLRGRCHPAVTSSPECGRHSPGLCVPIATLPTWIEVEVSTRAASHWQAPSTGRPSNKDRPDSRDAFASKCASYSAGHRFSYGRRDDSFRQPPQRVDGPLGAPDAGRLQADCTPSLITRQRKEQQTSIVAETLALGTRCRRCHFGLRGGLVLPSIWKRL